jgi:hypothetical protein
MTLSPLYQGLKLKASNLTEHINHHSPAYVFWVVKHGIKTTPEEYQEYQEYAGGVAVP